MLLQMVPNQQEYNQLLPKQLVPNQMVPNQMVPNQQTKDIECEKSCPRGYKPICAINEEKTKKTFITEQCMNADACKNGCLSYFKKYINFNIKF